MADVRKKYSLCSKISKHVLNNSPCYLNFSQDESVANVEIFPLKTYLLFMMKKGILYSSSSLYRFTFEELENKISLYVHSPCQPKRRETTPHFNPAPVLSEWGKCLFRLYLMTSQ